MRIIKTKEVRALLESLDELIEIKLLIRESSPSHDLNDELNARFITSLKALKDKLNPLFLRYLKSDGKLSEDSKKKLRKTLENIRDSREFILISSNSIKKKLKNLGFDLRMIIVSGGPLFIEDYKIINPNLPEKALEGIRKKCERVIAQLKNKEWGGQNLRFIHEKGNATDELILNKLEKISSLIGKEIQTIDVESWTGLN